MSNDQNRNRNEWPQLTRGNYIQTPQHQTFASEDHTLFPEGYASVQGYAPVGTQNGYPDHEDSTASPFGSYQTSGVSPYTIGEDGDNDDVPEKGTLDSVSSQRQSRKRKSHAIPLEGQSKSKRAERREKVANEHQGEVSATDQPKGLVEWREGVFKWWDPEDRKWMKAAYHDQYRDQFIMEDRTEGNYVVEPDRGKGANDITSACSAFNQLAWRLADRGSWDNVVDAVGNKVLYLIDRPFDQLYDEPERLWIHDGNVLLDGDNNPVRPWAWIPRCFSSKLEGGRLEALRRILPLTIQDFRARMLREVPTGAGIAAGTRPLPFPSTFGHRSSRFRALYQCPTWISRAASSVLRKQVTDLLPEAEEATTTEGLQRLSKYEVERRQSSTRGKYLYKANGRAISEDERRNRSAKLEGKLERLAVTQPTDLQRLQSIPTTPSQFDPPSPNSSTPPLSTANKRFREDGGLGDSNVGRPRSAAKRGRLSASPLRSRSQDHFVAPQMISEDPFPQVSNSSNALGATSTVTQHRGQSGSNSTGPGLNLRGDHPVNDAQYNNVQLDFRFVEPQNPLEQLRIQAALFYPRAHYRALIGEDPPHTTRGTYMDQYNQITAILGQRWLLSEEAPTLADVGPWHGSFDMVPTPELPDGAIWRMMCAINGPPPASEGPIPDQHAQVSSGNVGAENAQTASSSNTGLEVGGASGGWSDDLFGGYLRDYYDFE